MRRHSARLAYAGVPLNRRASPVLFAEEFQSLLQYHLAIKPVLAASPEPVQWPAFGVGDGQHEQMLLVRFERDHVGES